MSELTPHFIKYLDYYFDGEGFSFPKDPDQLSQLQKDLIGDGTHYITERYLPKEYAFIPKLPIGDPQEINLLSMQLNMMNQYQLNTVKQVISKMDRVTAEDLIGVCFLSDELLKDKEIQLPSVEDMKPVILKNYKEFEESLDRYYDSKLNDLEESEQITEIQAEAFQQSSNKEELILYLQQIGDIDQLKDEDWIMTIKDLSDKLQIERSYNR
ncbi:hypothetical protein [Traorella massiliensis]|uniref:hypothetical protein n=1 Tax=Traorella massiliensis TaxID=1903263 RepID=UPI0008F80E94|nr:hypothetical protein [Traorella massiliensis]